LQTGSHPGRMAVNEEYEQKMRELQRSYVDFLDDSDR
jgi:hypothetical protein